MDLVDKEKCKRDKEPVAKKKNVEQMTVGKKARNDMQENLITDRVPVVRETPSLLHISTTVNM